MRQFVMLLFALVGGLTLSGIAANTYRLLGHKPANTRDKVIYYAVMAVAGPSVMLDNATKSFRSQDCSTAAYIFAILLAGYWCLAIGLTILFCVL